MDNKPRHAPGERRKVIELVRTPIIFSGLNEDKENLNVTAHLVSGMIIEGVLTAFDLPQEHIEIVSPDKTPVLFKNIDELKYIVFDTPLDFDYEGHPALNHSKKEFSTTTPKPYSVTFNDETRITGEAAATIVEDYGLHIFSVIGTKKAEHIFIPADSMQEYQLGKKIGTMLKNNKILTDEQLQRALKQQDDYKNTPIGDYLKNDGIIGQEMLTSALKKQSLAPNIKIGQFLLEDGYVTDQQLNEALSFQKQHRECRLGEILVEQGAINRVDLHKALADKLSIPFINLKEFTIDPEAVNSLPRSIAEQFTAMPVMFFKKYLVIAVPDPTVLEDINVISFASNMKIELVVSTPEDIRWAINQHYGDDLDIENLEDDVEISPIVDSDGMDDDMRDLANQRPIIKLVQKLLFEGLRQGASDIHIRPLSKGMEVLFRVHGKLTHIKNYGKSLLPPIVARIKVIGRMDIAQHNVPQDGRVHIKYEGQMRDMRISVMPTVKGESVVIRLLSNSADLKPLDEIGLSKQDTETLDHLLHRSTGMLLVTGPTGSGKTTTLYSALNSLRERNLNIITAEDPVEIQLEGLVQVHVRESAGLDFSTILRNVLRHDPDVIMIGEIRDGETAKIATQAAQTGHLVLSSLHTNSAADTVVRLREMGIEPYLVASSLMCIISQRLVSRLCDKCKVEDTVSPLMLKLFEISPEEKFYRENGCKACNHTGIVGRLPAYELMLVSEELQDAITDNSTARELSRIATENGMVSIAKCTLRYARQGLTSLSEVHRVNLS